MIRRPLLTILALLCMTVSARCLEICDMGAAREWCDTTMLDRIEGIWEYPEDHTTVLISRTPHDASLYDIIAIESPDTRLMPGDKIGYLRASADADKFEMAVYRTKKLNGIFAEPGKCLAQYDAKDDAFIVKGRSMKFSLGSRWLLPAFWRMIRVSLKDPLENLPKGLVRIYPSTKRHKPDYL